MTRHIYNSAYVVISDRFWQTLSGEDQQLMQDCMYRATCWQLDMMQHLDRELEQKLHDKGMKFTYPDRKVFAESTKDAYASFVERFGDRADKMIKAIRLTGIPVQE